MEGSVKSFLFCRNDVWEVLYKIFLFRADQTTNMVVIQFRIKFVRLVQIGNKHGHHGKFVLLMNSLVKYLSEKCYTCIPFLT